jgi:Phosphotransferase enzyme family
MTCPVDMSNRNLPRNPMAPLLERALCALFSLSNKQVISSPLEESETVQHSAALLCLDGSAQSLNCLSDAGFRKIRPFAVLPSLTEPRWLLPEDNSRQAAEGLELYTPFSIRTRILKALGQGVALAGFPGRSNSRVLVASREPLPIENLVKGLSQESHPGFAISLGTPVTCQKLTVQAMSPAGQILAYIKIPLGPAAQARVKSETEILEKLSQFPRIRSRIPRLLSCADLGNGKILVQTPLPGNPGPTGLTRYHHEFLRELHACDPVNCPGVTVVEETSRVWDHLASELDDGWQDLARETLRVAARKIDGREILCAPWHGDFAPWNTRQHSGQLSCFDWESASWRAPVDWDKFHFLAQTQSLINEGAGPASLPETSNGSRISYLLYLLHSTAQLAAEQSPLPTLEYRRTLLRQSLSSQSIELPAFVSPSVKNVIEETSLNWENQLDD